MSPVVYTLCHSANATIARRLTVWDSSEKKEKAPDRFVTRVTLTRGLSLFASHSTRESGVLVSPKTGSLTEASR